MTTKIIFPLITLLSLSLFSACKDKSENRVWVFVDPIQCLGNPWEQAWLEEHDYDYDSYPDSELERLAIFEDYYEEQGVEIHDIRHERVYEEVCGACSCHNGDRIYCEIYISDLEQMTEWGFTEE